MRKKVIFCAVFLFFLPFLLFSGKRPFVGIEGDVFFPRGDWADELDSKFCYKITAQQHVFNIINAGLSIGGLSFRRSSTPSVNLSIFPIIYADIIALKQIKQLPLHTGAFLGYNISFQKITCADGKENATIFGWDTGGIIMLKFNFLAKPYIKGRYISRKDTDGLEFAFGILF